MPCLLDDLRHKWIPPTRSRLAINRRPSISFGPYTCMLDASPGFPYPGYMEVHFAPELQAKLDSVAAEIPARADQYVQQLVEHYLDHDVWFRQKVKTSLDQLDRGEFLSHEEVGERLGKMFQP